MKANQNTVISFNTLPTCIDDTQQPSGHSDEGIKHNNDVDSKPTETPIAQRRPRLKLMPYQERHVPTYHKWMQREELLELTASDRLDLEAEYESMRAWRDDEHKLTFILMEDDIMVGDVNICLLSDDDDDSSEEDNEGRQAAEADVMTAEVDVMIAETKCRRKGYAQLAVLTVMTYLILHLRVSVKVFVAKILQHNEASIRLFMNRLEFQVFKRVDVFKEIHLIRKVDACLLRKLEAVKEAWNVQKLES